MSLKRTKRALGNLLSLLGGKQEVIIDKEGIMSRLFHRGDKLLLDGAVIVGRDGAKKIIGKFLVNDGVCQGHEPLSGKPVMKASDFYDMAAQILGLYVAQHYNGYICTLRAYGSLKSRKMVVPGDAIVIEMNICEDSDGREPNPEVEERGGNALSIIGRNFSVKCREELVARVDSVELLLNPHSSDGELKQIHKAAPAESKEQQTS